MGLFSPGSWEQQWTDFMKYPYIMAVGVAITTIVVWWFRGFQIKIFERQLKLAADKVDLADRAKDEVERQFRAYKEEVASKVGNGALSARVTNVEAALAELSAASNAVRSALTGDIANFRGTVE
jgi:hypothetical protein